MCEKYGAALEFDTSVILEESKKFDAIIFNKDKLLQFEAQLQNLKIPIVDITWFESCILEQKFIDPKKHDIIKKQKTKARKGKRPTAQKKS
jgi:hypothetical protein